MLASLILAFNFIGFMKGLMMTFFILAALLLMLVVLIQEPKGGGLSSAFGGVGAETFGVQTGGVNKFTAWVAGIWMGLAILYAAWRPASEAAPSLRDVEGRPAVEKPADEGERKPGVNKPPSDQGSGGEKSGESGK